MTTKKLCAAAIFAALIAPLPAAAVNIGGINVVNLGAPRCVGTNAIPRGQVGVLLSRLTTNEPNATDPWPANLQGPDAEYSALVGVADAGSVAVFKFVTPRSTLNMIWGTPDEGNVVEFYNGKTLVARIDGLQITSNFGTADGVNLSLQTPGDFTVVRLIAYNQSFEFANFNVTCGGTR